MIHVTQTRIDLFGIACAITGWVFGYAHCWYNRQLRLRDAEKRREEAYRRYWNSERWNDGEPF